MCLIGVCSLDSTDGQMTEPNDPSIEPDDPSIQPFCLEEKEEEKQKQQEEEEKQQEEKQLPTVTSSSPPQPDQSESTEFGAVHEERQSETRNLIELETTEESKNKTSEVKTTTTHAITQVPDPVMCLEKFLDETDLGQKEAIFL